MPRTKYKNTEFTDGTAISKKWMAHPLTGLIKDSSTALKTQTH